MHVILSPKRLLYKTFTLRYIVDRHWFIASVGKPSNWFLLPAYLSSVWCYQHTGEGARLQRRTLGLHPVPHQTFLSAVYPWTNTMLHPWCCSRICSTNTATLQHILSDHSAVYPWSYFFVFLFGNMKTCALLCAGIWLWTDHLSLLPIICSSALLYLVKVY